MPDITKDADFWLEDGNLVLLVDGVYFKLYREMLIKQYGLFKDVLSLPAGSSSPEGGSVELPIHIPDVSAKDFKLLLSYMYGLTGPDLDDFSVGDQMRLIRVAHRLQAASMVYRLAKHLMQTIEPLARLSLCIEFSLDELRQEAMSNRAPGSAASQQASPIASADDESQPVGKHDVSSGWLADAFVAVVLDFDLKLPFHDALWPLDSKWRLHLATAREEISEGRRVAISNWAIDEYREYNFRGMDLCQATHLPEMTQSEPVLQRFWKDTIARGAKVGWVAHATESEKFMPSAETERDLVRQYLRKMYSTESPNI